MRLFIIIAELIAFVAAALWLTTQPGSVTVDLGGYDYKASLVVAFTALVALFLVVAMVLKIWHFIILFPARMYAYTQKLRPEKGVRSLEQGIIATALEEYDQARSELYRFERFLGDNGVYKALLAYNDMQEGNLESARKVCETMKTEGDEKTLGWIIQARLALKEGQDPVALGALQSLYQLHDRSPWVLRQMLGCALRLKMYDLALEVLRKAEKASAMPGAVIKQSRAQVLFEQAEPLEMADKESLLDQAHRQAPDMVNVAVQYARVLGFLDKTKKAKKVLEETWGLNPHWDLMEAYVALDHETDSKTLLKAASRLSSYNEHHRLGYICLARLALKHQEWGRARAALNAYQEKYDMDPEACYLMARLELSEHGDQASYREWMERTRAESI